MDFGGDYLYIPNDSDRYGTYMNCRNIIITLLLRDL